MKKKNGFVRLVWAGWMVVLVLAAVAGLTLYYGNVPSHPDVAALKVRHLEGIAVEDSGSITFELYRGESARRAGFRLEEAGLIRSSFLWVLLAHFDGEQIKTGLYRMQPPLSMIEIRDLFTSGKQLLEKVTVPEGLTIQKTAELCEEQGICTAREFIKAANDPVQLAKWDIPAADFAGFLYPDTYYFPRSFAASSVIDTMVQTFFDRVHAEIPASRSLSIDELLKKVILASIVEREYRQEDEAPLIAGVFMNRLAIRMPLQSCATVEFIMTELQGKPHPEVLYNQDIEMDHPYNTYIHAGLPPGPISSPGSVALQAVFNPAPSKYLYFRLIDDEAGRHQFSESYDDHLKATAIYVKKRARSK